MRGCALAARRARFARERRSRSSSWSSADQDDDVPAPRGRVRGVRAYCQEHPPPAEAELMHSYNNVAKLRRWARRRSDRAALSDHSPGRTTSTLTQDLLLGYDDTIISL